MGTVMNNNEYGQLGVGEYLHNQGCPWDTWTCYYAAKEEHLELLQYLHSHGYHLLK